VAANGTVRIRLKPINKKIPPSTALLSLKQVMVTLLSIPFTK
jgi:hypothetical protein